MPPTRKLPLSALGCVVLMTAASAVAVLLKCPDCSNMVSDKAVACPKCGAPIAFIKQAAAESTRSNAVAQADTRNCVVRIQSESADGFGLVVEQEGNRFVVFDQRLIDGIESLNILPTTTNTPIRYEKLELATDRALARLSTDSTNVIPLRMSPDGGQTAKRWLSLSLNATNGQVMPTDVEVASQDSVTIRLSTPPENLLCVCDEKTNLVAIAQTGANRNTAMKVGPDVVWIPVEPGNLRNQTRLLIQAAAFTGKNGPEDQTQRENLKTALKTTPWLTKHLRERATALVQSLDRPAQ